MQRGEAVKTSRCSWQKIVWESMHSGSTDNVKVPLAENNPKPLHEDIQSRRSSARNH